MLIYGAPAHAQNNKQPLVQPAPPVIKPNDLKSIPDKYFKEADEFLKYCEAQTNMTLFYNCDCLSYEFLETRIRNPQMSQTSIVMDEREMGLMDFLSVSRSQETTESTDFPLSLSDPSTILERYAQYQNFHRGQSH